MVSCLVSVSHAQENDVIQELGELYNNQPDAVQELEKNVASDAAKGIKNKAVSGIKDGKNMLKRTTKEGHAVAEETVAAVAGSAIGKSATKSALKADSKTVTRTAVKSGSKGLKYILTLLAIPFVWLIGKLKNGIGNKKSKKKDCALPML